MASSSSVIELKAIDVSGQLGSLYDASSDRLLYRCKVRNSEKSRQFQHCTCRISSGVQSNDVIHFLKTINFNDTHLQNVRLGLVPPSGISSIISCNQPVDQNTLFFYYSHQSREEKIDLTAEEIDRIVSASSTSTNATHIVTKILWGIEILCVIQVSDNQSTQEVESLLYRISNQLPNNDKPLELTLHEKHQIIQLSDVTVFGHNTYINDPNILFLIVLNKIREWQSNTAMHHPLLYTMQPLARRYNSEQFPDRSDENNLHIAQIESTITLLDKCVQDLKQLYEQLLENLSSSTIYRLLESVRDRFGILLSIHEEFRTNLRKIVDSSSEDTHKSTEINSVILDTRYLSLRSPASDLFRQEVEELLRKMKLIQELNNNQIRYINLLDVLRTQTTFLTMNDIDEILKNYLSNEDSWVIIWYSSDRLKREQAAEWEEEYEKVTFEQRKSSQRTSLIYADFTHTQQKLESFDIKRIPVLSSSESRRNHSRAHSLQPVQSEPSPTRSSLPLQPGASTSLLSPQQSSSRSSLPTSTLPSQKILPSVTEINVLLLGETGVGKSTFINAFVNYLTFNTLQQAEQGEPIVLIPVSFLITFGEQFEEFIVKFGDVDSNENHENEGQSVTQQCKSYVFNLNERLRLRLIDTPGMGDTRGVDQDAKNIDHILTYVNNLSHLNAVCLLLKPNTSQLNVFFRSCINQLLTYLTPIGYNNIIFCFTNARSTFYAPGDTGPLLRQMLKQEHLDGILFEKMNTFCFDNESFRYLAARKRGIHFDEFQNEECIKSWITSVNESVRLLTFIRTREPYFLNEWQSPKKVTLEISMLARPLMETLRLILYNWKLREVGSVNKEMILNSNPVTNEICSNCAQSSIVQVDLFWVITYESEKNKQCLCPFNERHFLIEATVNHRSAVQPIALSSSDLRESLNNLLYNCDRLIHFLRQKGLFNEDDPFTTVLNRFLDEEQDISNTHHINLNMNKRFQQVLHSLRELREQNSKQLSNLQEEELSLSQVYEIINELKSIRSVNEQIECIKTSRHLKMEANEYQLNMSSTKNTSFDEITNIP